MSSLFKILYASHWLATLLLFGIVLYATKLVRRPQVPALILFCFLAGVWSLFSALILQAPDLETKIQFNRLKFIAPLLLPLSILWLAVTIQGKRPWHKYLLAIAAIVPAISLLLWLGPWPQLLIVNYRLIPFFDAHLLAFDNGPWFVFHIVNAQVLFVMAIAIIYFIRRDFTPAHRYRLSLVMVAMAVPFLGDVLAVHVFSSLRYLQIVPTLLLCSALLFVYAIAHDHFVNVIPFAREHILDRTNDIYLVFDGENKLVDFNANATQYLKLQRSALSLRLTDLCVKYPELASLSEIEGQTAEWAFGRQTFELTKHDLQKNSCGRVGTVYSFKDVTVRKQNEVELVRLNQIKTRLLAVMSHDFQSNLGVSRIISENLLRFGGSMSSEETKQGITFLHHIATENIALVEELLTWSKYQLDAHGEWEWVVLDDLAIKVSQFLQPLAENKKVTIKIESNCLNAVKTDGASLTTILRNLIGNAIKFSPQESQVLLSMTQLEDNIEVMVADKGPGIARERWPTLFDIKKNGCEGIGLFLCREFVEKIGGKIWLESGESGGSKFFVSIPLT